MAGASVGIGRALLPRMAAAWTPVTTAVLTTTTSVFPTAATRHKDGKSKMKYNELILGKEKVKQ